VAAWLISIWQFARTEFQMTAVLCRRGQHLRRHWDVEEYPRALRDAGQLVI